MAIDSYMIFVRYGDKALEAESQVVLGSGPPEPLATDGGFDFSKYVKGGNVFEVDEYSFDVEQTLNIGSQSKGAGAGKITFNPFSISRKIDKSSPTFFEMACSGTAFQNVFLCLRKGAGVDTTQSGQIFLRFDFKLVAVKTISWSHDDTSPKEDVTFEYGGLQVRYCVQNPNGSMGKVIGTGWNLVQNKSDVTITPIS
jgi:type VI secretion system secreted protein Hcp